MAAILLTGGFIAFTPAEVAACSLLRAHDNIARHGGTVGSVSSLTGVDSTILEMAPTYSGWNGTGTNSSVMLTTAGITQWAQLGWIESTIQNGTIQRQIWFEFFVSDTDNRSLFWGPRALGTLTTYRIWYTSGAYYFYVNGTPYTSQLGIPSPTGYQVFGETHDKHDQFPGGFNAHELFGSTRYYTGATHVAHTSTSGILNEDTSLIGTSGPTSGQYETWDKGCPTSP